MNNEAKKIERFIRGYEDLKKKAPRIVGGLAVSHFKTNFRRQGFQDRGSIKPWKKRRSGADGRAVLTQSGRLKRSIRIERILGGTVVISAGKELKGDYAKTHNEGEDITPTPAMRRYFWAKYFASDKKDVFYKYMALAPVIRIPKRQFIGDSTDLKNDIEEELFSRITTLFNSIK